MKKPSLEEVRATSHIIKVHCPSLDEHMRPAPVLLEGSCPFASDGQCYKCRQFVGFVPGENGAIFAYDSFEGFCSKERKD